MSAVATVQKVETENLIDPNEGKTTKKPDPKPDPNKKIDPTDLADPFKRKRP